MSIRIHLCFDDRDFTAKTQEQLGLLKNAHTLKGTMVCCVALQTAPLNVCLYTPRGSVFCPAKAGQLN
jgi:hypothetical protein